MAVSRIALADPAPLPPCAHRSVSAMATAASLSFGGAALLGAFTLANLLKVGQGQIVQSLRRLPAGLSETARTESRGTGVWRSAARQIPQSALCRPAAPHMLPSGSAPASFCRPLPPSLTGSAALCCHPAHLCCLLLLSCPPLLPCAALSPTPAAGEAAGEEGSTADWHGMSGSGLPGRPSTAQRTQRAAPVQPRCALPLPSASCFAAALPHWSPGGCGSGLKTQVFHGPGPGPALPASCAVLGSQHSCSP